MRARRRVHKCDAHRESSAVVLGGAHYAYVLRPSFASLATHLPATAHAKSLHGPLRIYVRRSRDVRPHGDPLWVAHCGSRGVVAKVFAMVTPPCRRTAVLRDHAKPLIECVCMTAYRDTCLKVGKWLRGAANINKRWPCYVSAPFANRSTIRRTISSPRPCASIKNHSSPKPLLVGWRAPKSRPRPRSSLICDQTLHRRRNRAAR